MPVDRIPRKEAGLLFAQQATKFLEREWTAPYLSTVIGCMLLGTFHQVSAQPTLGWVYEGVGVRLANVLVSYQSLLSSLILLIHL